MLWKWIQSMEIMILTLAQNGAEYNGNLKTGDNGQCVNQPTPCTNQCVMELNSVLVMDLKFAETIMQTVY